MAMCIFIPDTPMFCGRDSLLFSRLEIPTHVFQCSYFAKAVGLIVFVINILVVIHRKFTSSTHDEMQNCDGYSDGNVLLLCILHPVHTTPPCLE